MLSSFLKRTKLWVFAVPMLAIVLGAGSNQAVLIANHGKFPVMLNDAQVAAVIEAESSSEFSVLNTAVVGRDGTIYLDDVHSVMRPSDNLKFMADVFNLRDAVYSIGDFILMIGFWLLQFSPIAWVTLVLKQLLEK